MSSSHDVPAPFTSETVELLERCFAVTWRELQERNSAAVSRENERWARVAIMTSMADLAATGVREPARLKRHALRAVEQARARKRTIVHLPD